MGKSCDFTTNEASAKAWFRTNKILDTKLNIIEGQLNAFRVQNTKFSKDAFNKYSNNGIKPTDRMFLEEGGGKKAVPNIDMFRRIDAAQGKFYPENMKYQGINFSQGITPMDRIVFGHPTIGKSYLKKIGDDRFISLDDDYSSDIINFVDVIAKKYKVTPYQVKDGRTELWNKEYNAMMQNLFDIAKQKALSENKTLFTSNTNLLENNINSFDKVINLTDKEFKKRIEQRGAKYDVQEWKSKINDVISKVPISKVITTEKYLSDLLSPTQKAQPVYSDDFMNDLDQLELTPEVIKYLYAENGSRSKIQDYAFILRDLVANLKSQGFTTNEILEDIKCL